MHAESRPGSLPLAEALIEWSDPALVDAIRLEEAAFAPGELARLGHYALDDLRDFRRSPRRPFPELARFGPTAALEAAWERLFGAFRLRVERGEIRLRGVPTISFTKKEAEDLPSEKAAEALFDPAAGAVFLGIKTYVSVTASQGVAEGQAAAETLQLPLRDAVAAWCDPRLVGEVRRLEALVRDEEIQSIGRVRLGPGPGAPSPNGAPTYIQSMATKPALAAAWQAVFRDLRQRIEAGQIQVLGAQTFPLAQHDRAPIPGAWASEFWFDLEANKINIVQFNRTTRIYTGILARGGTGALASVSPSPPPGQPQASGSTAPVIEAGARGEIQKTGAPKATERQRGGRTSSYPVVEAALRRFWDEFFPQGAPKERPAGIDLARRLRRRMLRENGAVDVPEVETIRKHLRRIYTSVLVEKVGREANAQKTSVPGSKSQDTRHFNVLR